MSFPTHTVLTPICSVCLIQPLCPPLCPTQHSPSQAISHPSSLSCSSGLQLDVSVPCRFQQPCKTLLNSLSRGHRFLQGSDKILQV